MNTEERKLMKKMENDRVLSDLLLFNPHLIPEFNEPHVQDALKKEYSAKAIAKAQAVYDEVGEHILLIPDFSSRGLPFTIKIGWAAGLDN